MMVKDIPVSPHLANSQTPDSGFTSIAPPTCETFADGQSVENTPTPTSPQSSSPVDEHVAPSACGEHVEPSSPSLHWFVIRATHGRAQQVYDEITSLNNPHLEVYLPTYHYESLVINNGIPEKTIQEGVIYHSLVFVRTTRNEYQKLVRADYPYPFIKSLTPYYDHFREREAGRNDYLTVPDRQFRSFRTLLESQDTHILLDQEQMPTYLNGKKVEVTSGPFTGVTGTLIRWKGLRRVFIQLDQIGTFATGFIRTCDFRIIEK